MLLVHERGEQQQLLLRHGELEDDAGRGDREQVVDGGRLLLHRGQPADGVEAPTGKWPPVKCKLLVPQITILLL